MTVYEDLLSKLNSEAMCMKSRGAILYADAELYEACSLAIEQLLGIFPHRCELCIGCELEELGGGCDTGFRLSTSAAEEFVSRKLGHGKTTGDRLRSMPDEDLAKAIARKITSCYGCQATNELECAECVLEWLKEEKDE